MADALPEVIDVTVCISPCSGTVQETLLQLPAGSTVQQALDALTASTALLDVQLPDASFYLWARVPDALGLSDTEFARELLALYNVTVLPGSYLARDVNGANPGAQRIRMALVADTAECAEAARRIAAFVQSKTPAAV